jgi:hypothetical protein
MGLLGGYVPLYFPTGRLPSRRWWPVPVLAAVPTFVAPVANLFVPFTPGTSWGSETPINEPHTMKPSSVSRASEDNRLVARWVRLGGSARSSAGRTSPAVHLGHRPEGCLRLPRHVRVGRSVSLPVPWRIWKGLAKRPEPASEALHQRVARHVEVVQRLVAARIEGRHEGHDERGVDACLVEDGERLTELARLLRLVADVRAVEPGWGAVARADRVVEDLESPVRLHPPPHGRCSNRTR